MICLLMGSESIWKRKKIADYFLTLDKEGDAEQDSKTLQTAHLMGLQNTTEVDSLSSCGVRMADMMAGIMTKLLNHYAILCVIILRKKVCRKKY